MIMRSGKQYVLYAGLLDEAHSKGLRRIDTELLQLPTAENNLVAVVKAVVEFEDGRTFSGIGDASPENVGRNIVPHIIRMAECVPLSTQILTRDGWRFFAQLTIGDEVLAYDVPFASCRWVEIQGVSVFEPTETVRLSSRSFDVVCTPDHKWAVGREGGRYGRRLRPANEFKTSDSIIVAAPAESGPHPLSERDAAVLGWLATDGSLSYATVGNFGPYPRAYIQQSKPEYIPEIRDLLGADAYEATTNPREGGRGIVGTLTAHRFSFTTEYLKRLLKTSHLRNWSDLLPLVTRISAPARAAMLDAMLKGDGHAKRGKKRIFGKKRKPGVMEAFEVLATLEGIALGRPTEASAGEVPLRTLRENASVNTGYLKRLPEGSQPVWCPTTECGTWVMRDASGTIAITGNTRSKARALRDAVNVGATSLEELSDSEVSEGTNNTRGQQQQQAASQPTDIRTMQGRAKEAATPNPQKARKSQLDLLRTIAEELRGPEGVERLEGRIGKPLGELTRAEADEWIDRLTPAEGRE